jgi:putative DNA primase/helicase
MTSETEEGQRLAVGKLKRITQGMGKIKACRKYENPVQFPETHKLWIDANHLPNVRGTDKAIWNRLRPIPFDVVLSPDEIDRDLPGKLEAEAEGILAWAVAGAVRWYREGLGTPAEVETANQAWRRAMDQIGRFIEDSCVTREYARAKAHPLYLAYKGWAEGAGEQAVSEVVFAAHLLERGLHKEHTSTGAIYEGIGLSAEGQR